MKKEILNPTPTRFPKDNMNMNLDTLLEMNKKEAFDFEAPYQRGYVWSSEQKEELISSILEWVPINAVYLNEYAEDRPLEVVDGKQRLSTIIEFHDNQFTWKGYYFKELPDIYRRFFGGFSVAIYLTRYKTTEECERLFDRINFTGTPHLPK